jgi:hypothetical protein
MLGANASSATRLYLAPLSDVLLQHVVSFVIQLQVFVFAEGTGFARRWCVTGVTPLSLRILL